MDEELYPACSAISYIVSHRHTILRNGAGSFEDFLKSGGSEGAAVRRQKWEWIQHGADSQASGNCGENISGLGHDIAGCDLSNVAALRNLGGRGL